MFPMRGRQLTCAQISARRQRPPRYAFRRFRQPQLPRRILRVKLRDAFQAKQCVFIPRHSGKHFRGLGVLLDSFLGMIQFLLQERVPRDAFRRLLHPSTPQEAVINRNRLILVPRIHQHIEQHSVINRRKIRLVRARIQIPERLRRLLVLGYSLQHRQISGDGILNSIFFEEAFCPVKMLVYVCGHQRELPLRYKKLWSMATDSANMQ